jgi:hypothetical protein
MDSLRALSAATVALLVAGELLRFARSRPRPAPLRWAPEVTAS